VVDMFVTAQAELGITAVNQVYLERQRLGRCKGSPRFRGRMRSGRDCAEAEVCGNRPG
jgi:hypothetical protein